MFIPAILPTKSASFSAAKFAATALIRYIYAFPRPKTERTPFAPAFAELFTAKSSPLLPIEWAIVGQIIAAPPENAPISYIPAPAGSAPSPACRARRRSGPNAARALGSVASTPIFRRRHLSTRPI